MGSRPKQPRCGLDSAPRILRCAYCAAWVRVLAGVEVVTCSECGHVGAPAAREAER